MPHFVLGDAMQTGILSRLEQKQNSGTDRAITASIVSNDRRGIDAPVKPTFWMRGKVVVLNDIRFRHGIILQFIGSGFQTVSAVSSYQNLYFQYVTSEFPSQDRLMLYQCRCGGSPCALSRVAWSWIISPFYSGWLSHSSNTEPTSPRLRSPLNNGGTSWENKKGATDYLCNPLNLLEISGRDERI